MKEYNMMFERYLDKMEEHEEYKAKVYVVHEEQSGEHEWI